MAAEEGEPWPGSAQRSTTFSYRILHSLIGIFLAVRALILWFSPDFFFLRQRKVDKMYVFLTCEMAEAAFTDSLLRCGLGPLQE
jgi:hypothetical protein